MAEDTNGDLLGFAAPPEAAKDNSQDAAPQDDLLGFGAPSEAVVAAPQDDVLDFPSSGHNDAPVDLLGFGAAPPAPETPSMGETPMPGMDLLGMGGDVTPAPDLFGAAPTAGETPQTPQIDLFGTPAETPQTDSSQANFFGTPAETPQKDSPPVDLFGAFDTTNGGTGGTPPTNVDPFASSEPTLLAMEGQPSEEVAEEVAVNTGDKALNQTEEPESEGGNVETNVESPPVGELIPPEPTEAEKEAVLEETSAEPVESEEPSEVAPVVNELVSLESTEVMENDVSEDIPAETASPVGEVEVSPASEEVTAPDSTEEEKENPVEATPAEATVTEEPSGEVEESPGSELTASSTEVEKEASVEETPAETTASEDPSGEVEVSPAGEEPTVPSTEVKNEASVEEAPAETTVPEEPSGEVEVAPPASEGVTAHSIEVENEASVEEAPAATTAPEDPSEEVEVAPPASEGVTAPDSAELEKEASVEDVPAEASSPDEPSREVNTSPPDEEVNPPQSAEAEKETPGDEVPTDTATPEEPAEVPEEQQEAPAEPEMEEVTIVRSEQPTNQLVDTAHEEAEMQEVAMDDEPAVVNPVDTEPEMEEVTISESENPVDDAADEDEMQDIEVDGDEDPSPQVTAQPQVQSEEQTEASEVAQSSEKSESPTVVTKVEAPIADAAPSWASAAAPVPAQDAAPSWASAADPKSPVAAPAPVIPVQALARESSATVVELPPIEPTALASAVQQTEPEVKPDYAAQALIIDLQSSIQEHLNEREAAVSRARKAEQRVHELEMVVQANKKLEAELADTKKQLGSASSDREHLLVELDKLREARDEHERKQIVLSNRLNAAKKKEAAKANLAENLDGDMTVVKHNLETTKQKLDEVTSERDKASGELSTLKADYEERLQKVESCLAEERRLNDERKKKMKHFVENKHEEIRESKSQNDELNMELSQTNRSLREHHTRWKQLHAQWVQSQTRNRELQREITRFKKESENMSRMGDQMKGKLSQSAQATAEHKNKRLTAKSELMTILSTLEAEREVSSKLRDSIKFTFTPKALSQQQILKESLRDFEHELVRLSQRLGKPLPLSHDVPAEMFALEEDDEDGDDSGNGKKSRSEIDSTHLLSNLEEETQRVSQCIMALTSNIERMHMIIAQSGERTCTTLLSDLFAGAAGSEPGSSEEAASMTGPRLGIGTARSYGQVPTANT